MSLAPRLRNACSLLVTVAGLAMLPLAAGAATLIHIYDLNGSLADGLGGPALISDGGTLNPTNYSFGPNQGLELLGGVPDPTTYTIQLQCELNITTGYRKLIDFENRASDAGLYNLSGLLSFYPLAAAVPVNILPNEMTCITLTRDASGLLAGYVNGQLMWGGVPDPSNFGVVGPAANLLRFFEDDFTTSQAEASGGVVDQILIWDGALSPNEVAAQCSGATPTHNTTWGSVKTLYR